MLNVILIAKCLVCFSSFCLGLLNLKMFFVNCITCLRWKKLCFVHYFNAKHGGICGLVVKVVDFKPLAPHRCGFEYRRGLWILSCEEAIQLAYGTSVVLHRCPFVSEIMHGRAPEVFISKAGTLLNDLYCVGVT
jgi:hypothetical protein